MVLLCLCVIPESRDGFVTSESRGGFFIVIPESNGRFVTSDCYS